MESKLHGFPSALETKVSITKAHQDCHNDDTTLLLAAGFCCFSVGKVLQLI